MAQFIVSKAIRSNLSSLWGHFFGRSQGNMENLRSSHVFWHRRALTRARRNQTSLSRLWKKNEGTCDIEPLEVTSVAGPSAATRKEPPWVVSRLTQGAAVYWKSLIVCTIQQGLFESPGSSLLVVKLWLRHEKAIVRIDEQRQAQLNIEEHRFTESLYSNKLFGGGVSVVATESSHRTRTVQSLDFGSDWSPKLVTRATLSDCWRWWDVTWVIL